MPGPRKSIILPFAPRPWQIPLIDDPAKRIVAVVHRRAGKSTALMWRGLKHALTEPKPLPRVVHILPYGVMWMRTGLWDQATRAADAIPGAAVRRSELSIKLPNGSTWQAGGADNPDAWRGGGADLVVVDEYDDTPASMVPLVIEPMLADRHGTLIRSGTPKGNGILQAAYERARTTPGHSAYLLDYTKTNALSDEAIERLRTEMTPQEFAQELECSFNSPNSGSYYGELMDQAEHEGRIGAVPHDPAMPVHTSWDLGVDDSTAIWFAQITKSGEWRLIDYIEDSGAGLDHYVQLLQERNYVYERHILPHDAAVRELGSGRSRIETLHSLGVKPTRIVRQHSVADGINAVRMVIPKAYFDATKCQLGIKALRHYRREWNESAQAWRSQPVHDHASHGCLTGDAMVLTDRGHRRIDTMRAGDRVWTPAGYALVEWAGPVKQAADLVRIELADGRRLECTPEHKIATQRGFVRADALRYLDVVLSGNEWQSLLIGSYSKARSTGYRATITDAMSGEAPAPAICIGRFGKAVTALCRRVARSITGTAIRLTTPWTISNALMPQSISGSTRGRDILLGGSTPLASFAASVPPNGMPPPLVSSGTQRTGKPPGRISSGLTFLARIAVRYLLRHSRSARSGVISTARWKTCGSGEDSQWVYDLTVRSHACYQANGFLVSNSDSLRYMALGVRDSDHMATQKAEDPFRTGHWTDRPNASGAGWMGL